MTRLKDPDPTMHPEKIERALNALPDLGLFRLLSHSGSVMPPWLSFGGTLLSNLTITPVLRELAILQVAATTQCRYEETQHVVIARAVGVPEDQIKAVVEGRLDDPCLKNDAPTLRVIDSLIKHHKLTDAEFEILRTNLNERQTVELLTTVGWYLSIALLAGAVDLTPDASANMAVVEASTRRAGEL